MGVGWQEAEYTATNMPFDARFGRLEDTVRACRELWTDAPTDFQGREFSFEDFHARPLPVQERVPVIFGFGPSRRNFDRIARVADALDRQPRRHADLRGQRHAVARHLRGARSRSPHRDRPGVGGAGAPRRRHRRPRRDRREGPGLACRRATVGRGLPTGHLLREGEEVRS
ncbi:LLM class flavin-dependent oxidoreductase [Rhodococcus hoagii]|nr:LLM class flavin-dependent oxidoreductase [Prescottella equi]